MTWSYHLFNLISLSVMGEADKLKQNMTAEAVPAEAGSHMLGKLCLVYQTISVFSFIFCFFLC